MVGNLVSNSLRGDTATSAIPPVWVTVYMPDSRLGFCLSSLKLCHNSYGTGAHSALTFKLDQLDGADHVFGGSIEGSACHSTKIIIHKTSF